MVAWTDEFGRRRTRRAYTDKALSERMARQLEDETRARRDGTIDMVVERMAAHAMAPLEDHLADYERAMEAKGNTPGHTKQAMKNIRFAAEVAHGKPSPTSTTPASTSPPTAPARRSATTRPSTITSARPRASPAGCSPTIASPATRSSA